MNHRIQKVPRVPQVSQVPRAKKLMIHVAHLILVLLFALPIGKANAQVASLRVSPSSLQIKAVTPTEITAPIIVENKSDYPVDLKIEFRQFQASDRADGQIEYLGHNSSPIFSKIQLTDPEKSINQLTLGPKQKKDLFIRISLNSEEKAMDHYFSIVFISTQAESQPVDASSGQHSVTKINSGVAMNILLSILPKSAEQTTNTIPQNVSIEEFSAPSFIEKGPISFNVKLQNKASNYVTPKGTIYVKNMFGQLIGKIDLQQSNILANSSRYLSTQNQPSTSSLSEVEGHNRTALWPESFLLGFYEATLRIDTAPGTVPMTKTIHFTALPSKLIIGLVVALVLILIIRKRIKQKMSVS